MAFKRVILLSGLCGLLLSCSTERLPPALQGSGPTEIGKRYLLGSGVPQDRQKAFYYFNQAAKDDDPFAENELGYMYASGIGTPRNPVKAFQYYHQAANHGLASAQYNLGLFYQRGIGTPVSQEMAVYWFQKSADNGFEPARVALKRNASR